MERREWGVNFFLKKESKRSRGSHQIFPNTHSCIILSTNATLFLCAFLPEIPLSRCFLFAIVPKIRRSVCTLCAAMHIYLSRAPLLQILHLLNIKFDSLCCFASHNKFHDIIYIIAMPTSLCLPHFRFDPLLPSPFI